MSATPTTNGRAVNEPRRKRAAPPLSAPRHHNQVMTQAKRLVVAINPSARFGATKSVGPAVVERLRALGHEVTSLSEPSYERLIEVAEAAIATKPDALIVVGGDGMVNLGANLVVNTDVPLGLVPSGTGNDMARALGIAYENWEDALAQLIDALDRSPRVIDAAHVRNGDGEERWYACILSAGFDAVVNERANRMRHPKGKSRYTIALLLELVTLKPISYRIVLDGTELVTDGMLVSVGNGVSLGGGMKVTPNALLDDGLLDVLVVGPLSRFSFLRIFPRVFAGTHITDPRVTIYRARKVRIEADGVAAYADGERVGRLPVDIEVKPGVLKVLAPTVAN
jgi:diacylglycerol kinase (ATP)